MLRRPLESALGATIAVMDETAAVRRPSVMKRLLQSSQDEVGVGRSASSAAEVIRLRERLAGAAEPRGATGPLGRWPRHLRPLTGVYRAVENREGHLARVLSVA